jgi:hypothetical protein
MPSYSRSRRRHASRRKMIKYRKKPQSTPYAPPELDAMLGYGTSNSFPLFMAGIVSLVKRLFGGKKHKK